VKVFKSVYQWIDDRAGMHHYIKREILDKPVPKGLNLSFCFGGITFFLFLMLAASGYFMTIYYVPSPNQAYQTVDYITHEVSLGYVVRGVHYWAANLMIVTVLLHMIRVFIYGAYKKPREAPGTQLDYRRVAFAAGSGIRFYRIPFALGSESLLGNKCRYKYRGDGTFRR